jgi:hypothetical protein
MKKSGWMAEVVRGNSASDKLVTIIGLGKILSRTLLSSQRDSGGSSQFCRALEHLDRKVRRRDVATPFRKVNRSVPSSSGNIQNPCARLDFQPA